MSQTKDRNGVTVQEGNKIRVLSVRPSVLARLSPNESNDVLSMIGEVLEVYEVDDWGGAWVKKWFDNTKDTAVTPSL